MNKFELSLFHWNKDTRTLTTEISTLNTLRFDVGNYTFWFSYKVLVAFQAPNHPRVVHENNWTKTTAKHLNHIDRNRPNDAC